MSSVNIPFLFLFREEFVYDHGVKTGPATLVGASGAKRVGQLKNGKWHGEATYTAQVIILRALHPRLSR